jgi:hypothetical protein
MTGWNLPPGCNVSDLPGNRPEDLLAEAVAEGFRYTCKVCKAFLSFKPDRLEPWEDRLECDGKPMGNPPYDYCLCGDVGKHPPHSDVNDAGVSGYHTCKRCGTVNRIEYEGLDHLTTS